VLSAAHQTVPWCTGQCTVHCPVRLIVGLTPHTTVGRWLFTPDTPDVTLDSLVVFSPQYHLELVVEATVPGAPDSPACGTGQSGVPDQTVCRQNFIHFLDFT
jgi:hypothetical protein